MGWFCALALVVWLVAHIDRTSALGTVSDLRPFVTKKRAFMPNATSRVVEDVDQCLCLGHCRVRPSCNGVAYSSTQRRCLLSRGPPTLNTTEQTEQDWVLAYRADQGMPGDQCSSAADCRAMVGPHVCRKGVCACADNSRLELNACLLPADAGFTTEVSGEPDPGSLLTSQKVAAADQCALLCRQTPGCLLLRTSTSTDGRAHCSLFSRVRGGSGDNSPAEYGADGGPSAGTVKAVKFHRAAGAPSATFRKDADGGHFALLNDALRTVSEAHRRCAELDGILFPAHSREKILAVFNFLSITADDLPGTDEYSRRGVFVGLDDFLTRGADGLRETFASSQGRLVTGLEWSPGEPDKTYCVYVNIKQEYHLNDYPCDYQLAAVCEFVGTDEAAAAGRSWKADRRGRGMTLELGAVYQLHSVRYESGQTAPEAVTVTVSIAGGTEMPCVSAEAKMAAPDGLSRQLICVPAAFGSRVHLRYEGEDTVAGSPSVFGTWVHDL